MKRQSRFAYHKFVLRRGINECWPWQGSKSHAGHGVFGAEGRQWYVHRIVAQEKYKRRLLPFPLEVAMHLCNNASCCNPRHILVGTPADNVAHAGRSGALSRSGARNGRAKLTTGQVRKIAADIRPSRQVAKEHGIEKTQVLRIRRGIQWLVR